MGTIIGIDLGTTNSAVAVADAAGRARPIAPTGAGAVMPSAVTFTGDEVAVGERALELAPRHPESSFRGIKRLLGRGARAPQVVGLARTASFSIAAAPNGDAWVRVRGRPRPPHEIAAHTLRALRLRAEDELGAPVTRAVIAVPAYFDHAQRQAVRDAGQIAGLEVVRLVNEPTAAALAYGVEPGAAGRLVAVFDVGGGTFDISVLRVEDDLFEVLAIGGDAALGGDDWDLRIVELLVDEVFETSRLDPTDSPVALAALRRAAEAAKIALSEAETTDIHIDSLFGDGGSGPPVSVRRTLSRSELEDLAADLCDRFDDPCARALADAGIRPGDLDEVLLVGGMTRAPMVRRRAERLLGRAPSSAAPPETAVAVGVAICAGVIAGGDSAATLLDVTSHSIGLRVGARDYPAIIGRGEPLPARARLVVEGGGERFASLFAGEDAALANNVELGRVALDPAVAELELEIAVDVDSMVRVRSRDPASGEVSQVAFRSRGSLSPRQLVRIVEREGKR